MTRGPKFAAHWPKVDRDELWRMVRADRNSRWRFQPVCIFCGDYLYWNHKARRFLHVENKW